MKILTIVFCLLTLSVAAQPKKVTERVPVTSQEKVILEFDFADKIAVKVWDNKEVLVEVMVEINEGEDNDIFTLSSSKTTSSITIEMDESMWKKISKDENGKWNNCHVTSQIEYTVYLPKGLEVEANTISGDYEVQYFGQQMQLKTISGAIDLTVPPGMGLDFQAKTISGEVYSDMEIEYPEGKEGLRQIIGQDIKGRINKGGKLSKLETISGNIYLREG